MKNVIIALKMLREIDNMKYLTRKCDIPQMQEHIANIRELLKEIEDVPNQGTLEEEIAKL